MQCFVRDLNTAPTGLGFGSSELMGGITRRDSIALLETAFGAGIRHFDTAPSYGYGEAERVLGATFASRRDQITITTKYGILPPRNRNVLGIARRLLLPVVKAVPSLKSRIRSRVPAAGGHPARARFTPEELRASIDASRAALRTDYIDILLLHEAIPSDLSDDLLAELERSVAAGKIRHFGIGSEAPAAAAIYRADRRFCPVLQFEWSVLSGARPAFPGSFVITHRSLSSDFIQLRAWLGANPAIARGWARELDLDVTSTAVLSGLMLAAAREANPDGMTLFSSRRPDNIEANVRVMRDKASLQRGAAFAALVARDAPATLMRQSPEVERKAATG